MSHKFKVEVIPHRNKDGSPSKTKKDYRVIDRTRSGPRLIGVETSQKAAQGLIDQARVDIVAEHLAKHPNDLAFKKKHGVKV
jgi:hypothetical protein